MLYETTRSDVVGATVTPPGGQGVLIGGNLIRTPAHCIDLSLDRQLALGDDVIEGGKTRDGELKGADRW